MKVLALENLINKWEAKANELENKLQVGKCGRDDGSYDHGVMDTLLECIEGLLEIKEALEP